MIIWKVSSFIWFDMIQKHCVTRDQKAHTKKHCRYQKIYQEEWRLNLKVTTANQGSAKYSFLSNSFLPRTKKDFEKRIFFQNLFWEKRKKILFSNSFLAKKEKDSFFKIFFGEKRKRFFFQNLFSISREKIFLFFSLWNEERFWKKIIFSPIFFKMKK